MAESKTASKDAMSRALGAAFLSHKVEELEKTVSTSPRPNGMFDRNRRDRRGSHGTDNVRGRGGGPRQGRNSSRRSHEEDRERNGDGEKRAPAHQDAHTVVVDASVLVHALGKLKDWCKPYRKEIIIVPLEALNTLDLLKKGTTPLAQRARAASRILEAQVGVNDRIRVQRDDAYVPWDEIPFRDADKEPIDAAVPENKAQNVGTPEWLRRTICCARWEFDNATKTDGTDAANEAPKKESAKGSAPPPVIVAVCLEPAQLPEEAAPVSTSPVPLPAPHVSKHEQRCTGTLVAQWAKGAGIPVLECKPTPLPVPSGHGNGRNSRNGVRSSSEDERRPGPPKGPMGRKAHRNDFTGEKVNVYGPGRNSGVMVERPAATMAMNASMMQPSKVIRVLARGEKLDP